MCDFCKSFDFSTARVEIGKRKCVVYHEKDGFIKIFKQDDFGKTVFLTKEEAEQKLKGGVDNGKQ